MSYYNKEKLNKLERNINSLFEETSRIHIKLNELITISESSNRYKSQKFSHLSKSKYIKINESSIELDNEFILSQVINPIGLISFSYFINFYSLQNEIFFGKIEKGQYSKGLLLYKDNLFLGSFKRLTHKKGYSFNGKIIYFNEDENNFHIHIKFMELLDLDDIFGEEYIENKIKLNINDDFIDIFMYLNKENKDELIENNNKVIGFINRSNYLQFNKNSNTFKSIFNNKHYYINKNYIINSLIKDSNSLFEAVFLNLNHSNLNNEEKIIEGEYSGSIKIINKKLLPFGKGRILLNNGICFDGSFDYNQYSSSKGHVYLIDSSFEKDHKFIEYDAEFDEENIKKGELTKKDDNQRIISFERFENNMYQVKVINESEIVYKVYLSEDELFIL